MAWGSGNLGGSGGGANKSMIFVTAPEGTLSVTAAYGGKTRQGKLTKDGLWRIEGLVFGPGVVWRVTASNGTDTATAEQPMKRLEIIYLEMSYYDGRLYLHGDQCEKYTGGWASSMVLTHGWQPVKLTFEPDHMAVLGGGTASAGFISTKRKINLEGYSRIEAVVSNMDSYSQLPNDGAIALTSEIGGSWWPLNQPLPALLASKTINDGPDMQTVVLDISGMKEAYVGIKVSSSSTSLTARIHSIRLIK